MKTLLWILGIACVILNIDSISKFITMDIATFKALPTPLSFVSVLPMLLIKKKFPEDKNLHYLVIAVLVTFLIAAVLRLYAKFI